MTALGLDLRRAQRRGHGVWLDLVDRAARLTVWPRSVVRPVTSLMTHAAWLLVAVVPVTAWAGMRWDWVELQVIAWSSMVLLLVCAVFVLGRHQVVAHVDLSRGRVVVGERATGRLVLTNRSRRRSFPVTVELPVGTGRADFDVPSLVADAEHEELFAIPTDRRCVLDVGPVSAVRADPFAILKREQRLTEAVPLYVHPRTVPVAGAATGIVTDLEGKTTRKLTNSDVSFHALRSYVPGDDRRYVHWKTTARTNTMMVRQFEETRRSHLLVVLSTRVDDYADQDEFELAVSAAGSLGLQTLIENQGLTIATSGGRLRTTHSQALLDELAGVDFERQVPRLGELSRRLAREVPEASVAIVLAGTIAAEADLRAAARRFPVDTRTICLQVCGPDEQASVRRSGSTEVARMGRLLDLPALTRRLTRS